jgi:hypothetical protein
LDVSLLLAFARRAKPVLAKRFKKQKALSCVAARLQRVFACGLASLRQLHAAARRESHPDVDRRACWSLSGRTPPLNFSFHGFSRKSGWFAEDACGSRRGVFVIGLARFPERDDALKRK